MCFEEIAMTLLNSLQLHGMYMALAVVVCICATHFILQNDVVTLLNYMKVLFSNFGFHSVMHEMLFTMYDVPYLLCTNISPVQVDHMC